MSWPHGYERELTAAEIERDEHRACIGGRWEEIGRLQFDFLCARGLRPTDRLLDVGCGSLRGGVHFIRYLRPAHYYGIDMNASLLKAGREVELVREGLADREPHLLRDEWFDFARFGATFTFALAASVFTHLSLNSIQRCLVNMSRVLEPRGRFFATYFEAPTFHCLDALPFPDGGVSRLDADPFHYHFSVFPFLIRELPLTVTSIGAWDHPRGQHMLEFVRS